jgi:uncharacterized FlaG/YvyC family protein
MDFGNAPKVAAVGGVNVTARADIVATQGSVSVELPPEKTVQSAQAGDAVRVEVRAQDRDAQNRAAGQRRAAEDRREALRAEQNMRDVIERRLVIEPRTRAIVLQKRDRETGETIEQMPDERLLKLRIYSRELADRAREAADGESRHYIERTA